LTTTFSLRRGLTLRLSLLMLVFSLIASAVVYQLALRFGDEAYDEWLLDSARTMAQLLQVKDDKLLFELPMPALQAFVFDAHDRVLFRVDDAQAGLIAGNQNLRPDVFKSQGDVQYAELTIDAQPMRAVQLVLRDVAPGHTVRIVVAESLLKRQRLASRVLGTVMALSGLLALFTVLLARDAITRGLRPLSRLADTVRLRPPGVLTRLPQAEVAHELRTFTDAINDLLGRLDQAMGLQRRFIADAAHQMRTPLAALKMELEHALREPDPLRHQQALEKLRGGLDRLSRLTHQLLTLARAEPGNLADGSFQPCDWRLLSRELGLRQLPVHLAAGQDLAFEGDDEVWVRGDGLLLEELLLNLLDNARRYAGPGAQILVSVRGQAGQAVLTVQDDGPGVPDQELPQLTKRFHRPPGSPHGGSGLGMAIVDEITRLHGGSLVVQAVPAHGLCIQVTLPLSRREPKTSA